MVLSKNFKIFLQIIYIRVLFKDFKNIFELLKIEWFFLGVLFLFFNDPSNNVNVVMVLSRNLFWIFGFSILWII